jgi:hypothetical protein
MVLRKLFFGLFSLFAVCIGATGVGRFDSHDGTYSAQTDFDFYKQLFYQARTRSLMADLSSTVGGVGQQEAFAGPNLSESGVIKRQKIDSGDMFRYTLEENMSGLPTYGDMPVRGGDFLEFKNMEARVNRIDSPAQRVVGDMSQQRVRGSIQNLPEETKRQIMDWCAEQMEYEGIPAFLEGGSPSVLKPTSQGGLGVNLGVGNGAGASVPLMNKHWYTPAAGFISYNTTPATWNSAVNTAIGNITSDATHRVTLNMLDIVRAKLDDERWNPVSVMGKRYKAICGCDPDVVWRIKSLLKTDWTYARERGQSNPIFNVDYMIEKDDVMYFAWRNLKKYRPAANGTNLRPDFGPLATGQVPSKYSTSSTNGLMIFMGANALVEGYNDSITPHKDEGRFEKGLEVNAHFKLGYVRGEWYAKDGRTDVDAVENRSVLCAAVHEPGVGQA